jgi:hypothetical protein
LLVLTSLPQIIHGAGPSRYTSIGGDKIAKQLG